jgi:predicted metallopeptidase
VSKEKTNELKALEIWVARNFPRLSPNYAEIFSAVKTTQDKLSIEAISVMRLLEGEYVKMSLDEKVSTVKNMLADRNTEIEVLENFQLELKKELEKV